MPFVGEARVPAEPNAMLFGLYVDGLEQHLLETAAAGIDAPKLMGVMVPLLYIVC